MFLGTLETFDIALGAYTFTIAYAKVKKLFQKFENFVSNLMICTSEMIRMINLIVKQYAYFKCSSEVF